MRGAGMMDPGGGFSIVRFYHFTAPTEGFTGVEFRDGRVVGTYEDPRSVT